MSRAPFRDDPLAYGPPPGGRGGTRWDTERFAMERDRNRFGGERERFEERDTRITREGGFDGRTRERSVDEIYERRGPRGFEEDRYERRTHYDDEPRTERERPIGRERGNNTTITFNKEREYYSPSPPRRAPARPAFLRRQSSLDTFDRKPLTRFVEREEYGPPARYREEYDPPARYREEIRPPPLTPIPLPRTRQLPPPRRYEEKEYYDEIKVAEPDYYGDDEYRDYPERVREREIIRHRRRSRSRDSHRSHSHRSHSRKGHSHRGSVRSSSVSSSSSSESVVTVRSEFPKKGKTRMPARLVSKQAIIDLGYPFEEEGDVIIIMKALGRENIDEVIKLSEDYKGDTKPIVETSLTTYLVGSGPEMSGGRSEAGTTIFEEHKTQEVYAVPPPPPPPLPPQQLEVVTDRKITEHRSVSPGRSHHHHHNGAIIIDGGRPREEYIDRSDPILVGPLALAVPERRPKDERAIRAEIRALEAEKEALRAEKRADRELRIAERIRHGGRSSESDLVLYDRERFERDGEEVTLVRKERIEEPEGGVRIEKDRKGPPPKLVRAMLATLT